jgi:hypothetical protein
LGSGQYTPDQSDIIYSVITKQEPYVERVGIDGLAKMEIVGGTVAWNQLIQNGDFADGTTAWAVYDSDFASLSISDGEATVTITNPNPLGYRQGIRQQLGASPILRHIYYASYEVYTESTQLNVFGYDTFGNYTNKSVVANSWNVIGAVFRPYNTVSAIVLRPSSSSAASIGDTYKIRNCKAFDLTQMFGTTIADYVYSLEQSVEGSGLAWLQSYGFFTKDYYEYDAGSLQNVCTSARKIIDLDGNERTYPIDDVQLRGLFKLDTNNKLYCDGDIYKSSGNVTRNYETRAYQSGDESLADAITDGTNTVVKLTTPTTETADPYINPQRSIENGTEEFIDGLTRDVMVPVGNVTQYYQSEIIPIISEYIDAVMASN